MLTQLHIQNIAVIHKASIRFERGFNVFTGETGAGKTILISAIDAVLGERTSRDIIRTGEEKALVSALFEDISPKAAAALEEQGYPAEDGSVLIVREITSAGKNSCKINGMPATAGILREIASGMISIHGQRDSLQLLAPERHLELLDMYGGHGGLLSEYQEAYEKLRGLRAELSSILVDDAQKAQRIDMLTFQVEEIKNAGLDDPAEEETLLSRRKAIRNSERIRSGLSAGYEALNGGGESPGIGELFDRLVHGISEAAEFLDELAPLSARLEEIGYELVEAGGDLRRVLDEFDFDQREIDDIESRLDTIYRLKRKYGADITEILSYYERAERELEALSTSEERAKALEQRAAKAETAAKKLAKALSEMRMAAADSFILAVEAELFYLDMPDAKLSVSGEAEPLSSTGADRIEFLVVTNVGEPPKPLGKIASGGEIARMMLAVKNVLADKDVIDTLIFDEVDTGVSGRAAGKIGAKLRQASASRQVICVTHLAQVAACADHHLYIHKEVDGDRTFTKVSPLSGEGILRELARITSGDHITPTAIENARELKEHSRI